MPKREDIQSILVIGAGPIIIGQACEFDYSGSQACKALKEEGYRVILVNSNPATIMTDPEMADRTYIEPVSPEVIRKVILKENPHAILPTIGGQTGLNVAIKVAENGFLEEHGVELIGADIKAIEKAENRELFKKAMEKIGLRTTRSKIAHSIDEATDIAKQIGFPIIIRASFTLGGTGGSIAYNMEEFKELAAKGLGFSIANEIIVEESIVGWKEYELEVMRDRKDNVVIICSIENIDPVGIHTGDSITVAPQQTLSDRQYQDLRDYSIKIIREIGVNTGGSNIQFAVHPKTGEIIVIEMNPRVSRSSALASKATGFPIAKIAAKLAVGYTLDEIANDITKSTPASFEPTIDYVVTKIPRFAFEKFSSSDPTLGVQMKSVGEVMSIGRTFNESFQKGIRGLETGSPGFNGYYFSYSKIDGKNPFENFSLYSKNKLGKIKTDVLVKMKTGHYNRLLYLKDAFYLNISPKTISDITKIDQWFVEHLSQIFNLEKTYWGRNLNELKKDELKILKANGFGDEQLAAILNCGKDSEDLDKKIKKRRQESDIAPVYKLVDTCSSEFEAYTPYYYSCYDEEDEISVRDKESNKKSFQKEKVVIIGGGPNRIGQGIEFDYMCVQASLMLKELGYETIMINSNPETVSTDYDVSSHLFFEPVTFEDVMGIIDRLNPKGVIVQLGGQTPLNIAERLEKAGVNILGTSASNIFKAEDRDLFKNIIDSLGYKQPQNAIAHSFNEGIKLGEELGYPLVVRPSFVLGGRAMRIVFSRADLATYLSQAVKASRDRPILLDRYLEDATELDVDCIFDGKEFVICGIMEHVEEAGIHSGDSACIFPAQTLSSDIVAKITSQSEAIAKALEVKGLMNIQFAIKKEELFFLEVNPRGSRTVPFISKASGIPWVRIATQVMVGKKLKDIPINVKQRVQLKHISVKEAVLPFDKFPAEDTILGPEMKSTGEVMGLGQNVGQAFIKAQMAAGNPLPINGGVLVTVNARDKAKIVRDCQTLSELGFFLFATEGTHQYLKKNGINSKYLHKINEGRPDIRDAVLNNEINLIFNTPMGKENQPKDQYIRKLANQNKIPIMTTIEAMHAAVKAIDSLSKGGLEVKCLQEYHSMVKGE